MNILTTNLLFSTLLFGMAAHLYLIPVRSNPDLFEIGVAGQGVEALAGERIPGAA